DGNMTIHGVTKKTTSTGTITIKGNQLTAKSKFKVKLADYNVTIPSVVSQNIAEVVDVNVNVVYTAKE
nr:YceI family protein [Bacteroidota bacterium]